MCCSSGTRDPDSRLLWGRSPSHPGGVAADQGWGVPGSRRRQEPPPVTREKFVALLRCDRGFSAASGGVFCLCLKTWFLKAELWSN